jgi:hypothetical protein
VSLIHPTKGIVELPWQIYEDRNALLRKVAILERRVQTLTKLNRQARLRLKAHGSGPKLRLVKNEDQPA